MLIEEYKDGPTTIKIYDDYICSEKESNEILQRVADNFLLCLYAQAKANKEKKDKTA